MPDDITSHHTLTAARPDPEVVLTPDGGVALRAPGAGDWLVLSTDGEVTLLDNCELPPTARRLAVTYSQTTETQGPDAGETTLRSAGAQLAEIAPHTGAEYAQAVRDIADYLLGIPGEPGTSYPLRTPADDTRDRHLYGEGWADGHAAGTYLDRDVRWHIEALRSAGFHHAAQHMQTLADHSAVYRGQRVAAGETPDQAGELALLDALVNLPGLRARLGQRGLDLISLHADELPLTAIDGRMQRGDMHILSILLDHPEGWWIDAPTALRLANAGLAELVAGGQVRQIGAWSTRWARLTPAGVAAAAAPAEEAAP